MVTITVSGAPGAGTTTISKLLEKKLGIKYIYSGALFRDLAKKHKMTLEEFGRYCETHKEIDQELDDYQIKILKKGNLILEGRLAGWLAHQNKIAAKKILIQADLDIRAQRIVNREQGNIDTRKQEIIKREKSEANRYKSYYDIDITDTSIYDIVIDSSNHTPEEILNLIIKKI